MKRLFFAIAVLIFYNSALAQEGLNGETEIGTDGQHGEFFSQFLNYDGAKIGFVGRYFKVENVIADAFTLRLTLKVIAHKIANALYAVPMAGLALYGGHVVKLA